MTTEGALQYIVISIFTLCVALSLSYITRGSVSCQRTLWQEEWGETGIELLTLWVSGQPALSPEPQRTLGIRLVL